MLLMPSEARTPQLAIGAEENFVGQVDLIKMKAIYWNDEEINKQTLESRLATAAQQTPQPPLNLRGDRTTKMRVINDLTKVAQEQGMLDVGFVATKEKGQ